jgi:hypothetical protein
MNNYLAAVEQAWNDYDGDKLAELLSFDDKHAENPKLQQDEDPSAAVERILEEPIDDIVSDHLRTLYLASERRYVEAYECQVSAVQNYCKLLSSQKDDNWPLPIMYAVCLDLRRLASSADKQLEAKGGKPGETLEKAAEHMMSCFRTCALDSKSAIEVTKRWGILNIVNQLFKIYFQVNKLHLCKPLIRAIESSVLKDRYPKAQQVTYKYYVGRKYMFDNSFKEADEYLSYAFEHCHRNSTANKRSILIYLTPVKMLLGQMPTLALLQKYNLLQFADVVTSVKQGNLLLLNEALDKNERFFIKCGIFLILEKLKIITYRNLFKKVSLLVKSHQIPIDAFVAALKMMKVDDIDNDETQCIIANLIYEGRIKGYISHQHQKLVVSKQQPFPSLSVATS